ncbi:hypothetical protein [Nonomuraea typhae]|uniref:hypothetical protein n=1 Tax=Nonomuraea typhae TaxID=2603600 RepID=UPI0012FC9748|nr:hypothetical protein [Nonomuraea typhae]
MAEELSFAEKIRTVGLLSRGRSGPRVREGRRADGVRVKATIDELGNTTTEHATRDDRVDVALRPQTITVLRNGES